MTKPLGLVSARMQAGSTQIILLLLLSGLLISPARAQKHEPPKLSNRSSSIALSGNEKQLFNVNTEANSLTVFRVDDGANSLTKLAEVAVGREPFCVAVRAAEAYVTNAADGTVSVISRAAGKFRVVKVIDVGTEPRGCALDPEGNRLFVANHTEGTVSIIDTATKTVMHTVDIGRFPFAITIHDYRAFVTRFYARLLDPGPGEGVDLGKEGVIYTFPLADPDDVSEITLSPLADSGFTADRSAFCNATANPDPVNETFCPADLAHVTVTPAGVFPNQLASLLACGNQLYVPNIGAQPEPPVKFDTNVQALVHVVNTDTLTEETDRHVNLNTQIATEPTPANPFASLGKLFGNDLVAMDTDSDCERFYILSRGGNYVIKARLVDDKLNINAPSNVVRFQTGNIPTGLVVDREGHRAFVNNQVNLSVSILNLDNNTVIARDIPSSTPPAPGSFADSALKGELTFFTALGVPDNDLRGLQIRDIVPLESRGKQSANAWSTCASCHPGGLADGVTWIFPDGPRQTIPTDATYSKRNGAHDARILNWSAARDSVTDFNNNSRAVQNGIGFAGNPPNPAIFDHGISQGGSEALDDETTWVQTVRPLNVPQPPFPTLGAGADLFETHCASCHGGAKWTKSQVFYLNNPALKAALGTVRDPGLTVTANQVVSYADANVDTGTLNFLEKIGTFSAANPIEIRGAGPNIGKQALGADGFNVPSLISIDYHAPYFHNGAAQTLEEVFSLHQLNGGMTIADVLSDLEEAQLLAFLRALDSRTNNFESQGDIFKDPTRSLP